jgi:hypothetical protein
LWQYLHVLNQAATVGSDYPKIEPVIPHMQKRFHDSARTSSDNRIKIAGTLRNHALRFNSPLVKEWLRTELNNALRFGRLLEERESSAYKEVLKSLETD